MGPRRSRDRASASLDAWVVERFLQLWYEAPDTWKTATFAGRQVCQCPFDLWNYQEVIARDRPPAIIQTGVFQGGSLLWFAWVLDVIGAEPEIPVVGVDIDITEEAKTLDHPRIRCVEGDSIAPETLARVRDLVPKGKALVSLDSDHSCAHVLKELEAYGGFVPPGGHLVVEDTMIGGHPVMPNLYPGPMEAVDRFLAAHSEFARDDAIWQRNLVSFHHHGWLTRLS